MKNVCNLKRALGALLLLGAVTVLASTNIEPARVEQIAAMLSPMPASFGQPVTNRAVWTQLATNAELDWLLPTAKKMAKQPDPKMTDALYLDFSRTGNRDRSQKVQFARSARLETFTLAECVEDRGRFLKPLKKTIADICAERAWPYAAHDPNLDVFYGRAMNPDLRATTLAFDLATVNYLLGNKLSEKTRRLIRDNVQRRVLTPFYDMVEGRLKEEFWLRFENNWNAVCLAGTVGAALAIEKSPERRAWYIAAAERYIPYFLHGFTPDGYCSEGVGYWNYGFGHYVMLTESIRQATGGRLDWFASPAVVMPAQFGLRSEIINGIYPTISDVGPGTKPSPNILRYVCQRLQLAPPPDATLQNRIDRRNLSMAVFELFAPNVWPVSQRAAPADDSPLRTWFGDGGVLIDRPRPGDATQFAAVIKGGNNGESHNHDDVGSFSVVAGKSMVICDPGGEVYTARTFSPRRYESGVLNSFGHAVPVVAGKLQSTGKAAHAAVLHTHFTDNADTLVFDLRSAYPVPDLTKLKRTFVYHRGPRASLSVTDEVAFTRPETFESALITWGKWKRISTNEFGITDAGVAVRVKVNTGGLPFKVQKTLINEHVHTPKKPWHIGILLQEPVTNATVSLTVTPARKL